MKGEKKISLPDLPTYITFQTEEAKKYWARQKQRETQIGKNQKSLKKSIPVCQPSDISLDETVCPSSPGLAVSNVGRGGAWFEREREKEGKG